MDDSSVKPGAAPRRGYDGPPMRVSGESGGAEPDELMADIRRSIMTKTLLVSITAHLILVGFTSFGLYAKWAKWGVAMPNTINKLIDKEKRDAQEAQLLKEREDRAARYAKEAADKTERDSPSGLNAEHAPDPRKAALEALESQIDTVRPAASDVDIDFDL